MFRTVANCRLIQAKTLLKGFEGFSTDLADLADDGTVGGGHFRAGASTPHCLPPSRPPVSHSLGGCAASNAHLKVVTVPMPGLWLGGHTLAILIQLPAAVSSCDFQGCLHLQASSGRSERRAAQPDLYVHPLTSVFLTSSGSSLPPSSEG